MYPVWEVPYITAGLIIGIIATFHILPSHLSVGAMWINVWVERKAVLEGKEEYMEFVKKYALLLLIFAYVFGSLSGIGIWFATTVASPRGISALIHNYVWGWATEWVFFIIEVSAIFIYYYTLGKISPKLHLKIGWIFAVASWVTMIIITGILAFMLTPGKWPETGNFFHGFFNRSYFPQLFTRTAFMFMVAGAYALAVSSTLKNERVKSYVRRVSATFGTFGTIFTLFFAFIYVKSLPEHARELLATSQIVSSSLKTWAVIPVIITGVYFVLSMFSSKLLRLPLTIAMILVLFVSIWNGERIRESLRKPYVVPEYMYSNEIIAKDMPAKGVKGEVNVLQEKGLLKVHPFVPSKLRSVNENNKREAGRVVAVFLCSACHSLTNKGIRPLPELVKRMDFTSEDDLADYLDALGAYPYMPPFTGNDQDKHALAKYLVDFVREGKQ